MKGTGAKRNVCPGSCVSTGAKFPVSPVESAPMHQVDHVPNGPTNSAAITTMLALRLCGGKLLVAVTRERRYGPSRLRVNDDDFAHLQ